ncbi:hypothetical protein ACFYO1_37450 [Nocardia sp. NPDC006044]|uniref:hypothetical protein n=1 Tax=Nocardia sp. NPDC006044 TaxID=3364306 RepID=UPI0036BB1FE9
MSFGDTVFNVNPPRAPPTNPPLAAAPTHPLGEENDVHDPVATPAATLPAAEPTIPEAAPMNAPRPVAPHAPMFRPPITLSNPKPK